MWWGGKVLRDLVGSDCVTRAGLGLYMGEGWVIDPAKHWVEAPLKINRAIKYIVSKLRVHVVEFRKNVKLWC